MNRNIPFMDRLRYRLKAFEYKLRQYRNTTNEYVFCETEYGKVKGVKRLTVYAENYYSFEGIPYAQPPLGELRFKAPQRPTPWDNVLDCTNACDKAVQWQLLGNKLEGNEDCLYLNVYTNDLSPTTARPVMVYIHGGGFIIGEANREQYGPDYFMRKDVVFVTIQYRLGVLGFLSLEKENLNVPGNAGLKDQVMALKWIKNNCANFGGNPDCITVFGESAGGASTHYMTLTEKTQGLFHRAILMSGNALCPWALKPNTNQPFILAKLAGYKGEDNENDILEFLLKVKAKDLIKVEERVLTAEERQRNIMFPFGPVVEPYITADCVLPKHPRELQKNSWGNSLPLLVGNTSFEGLLWLPDVKLNPNALKLLDTCVTFVPAEIADNDYESEATLKNAEIIKKTHVNNEDLSKSYLDIFSYLHFWFPLHRLVSLRFQYANGAPIYLYRYDFDAEEIINPYRYMRYGRGVKGVSHADELTYLFSNLLTDRLSKDSRSYRNIQRTVDIWTQFATTGNPYSKEIDGMDAIHWDALNKSDDVYQCLNISDELKFINLPEMDKIKAWESMYTENMEQL